MKARVLLSVLSASFGLKETEVMRFGRILRSDMTQYLSALIGPFKLDHKLHIVWSTAVNLSCSLRTAVMNDHLQDINLTSF